MHKVEFECTHHNLLANLAPSRDPLSGDLRRVAQDREKIHITNCLNFLRDDFVLFFV